MKKVIKQIELETVTLDNIQVNKMLVGVLRENKYLVFSSYTNKNPSYGLTTCYNGLMNNWSRVNDAVFVNCKDLYKHMFDNCSDLYQVDSWEDVVKIIEIHKPIMN